MLGSLSKGIIYSLLLHSSLLVGVLTSIYYTTYPNNIKVSLVNNIGGSVQKPNLSIVQTNYVPKTKNIHSNNIVENTKKVEDISEVSEDYTENNIGVSNNIGYNSDIKEDAQEFLNYKHPQYPKKAIALKQEGEVIVYLFIKATGEVLEANIGKSSGYQLLDTAVLDTIKYWNMQKSFSSDRWVQVRVKFQLN